VGSQLGFAEAFVNRKAGKNRRLEAIDRLVDWTAIERLLPSPRPASCAGRPGYAALPMFKATLLAQWYRLSDPALEEALSDRLSFRRFCDFALDAATPDETTLCRFRNELAQNGIGEKLMGELDRQLGARQLLVKDGTMIDATLIEAQAARPKDKTEGSPEPDGAAATTGEGSAFKAAAGEAVPGAAASDAEVPEAAGADAAVRTAPPRKQKRKERPAFDRHARFARKGGRSYYGYKAHVAVDAGSGLIRRACLTPANVHDTVPADELVMGDEKAVYADKAYATHARRASLKARGIKDRIMHRANKHQPTLPPWQKRRNQLIAKTRARVERTFAIWQRTYGYTRVRYFTLVANAFELQMKCFAFNLRRLAVLSTA